MIVVSVINCALLVASIGLLTVTRSDLMEIENRWLILRQAELMVKNGEKFEDMEVFLQIAGQRSELGWTTGSNQEGAYIDSAPIRARIEPTVDYDQWIKIRIVFPSGGEASRFEVIPVDDP